MTIFVSGSGRPASDWYDDVAPFVKGLEPGAFMDRAISDAVVEYCERTKVLEMDHPAINLLANQSTYSFSPGALLKVVEPLYVAVDGTSIDPSSPDELDAMIVNWRTVANEPAQAYYCPDEDSIRIVPTPLSSLTGGLTLRVAVKPEYGATDFDQRLFTHRNHRLAIADGAISKLLLTVGQDWYNKVEGDERRLKFEGQCGQTALARAKGRSRMPTRIAVVDRIR